MPDSSCIQTSKIFLCFSSNNRVPLGSAKETLSPQWTLKNVYEIESVPPQIFILSLVIWQKILTQSTEIDQAGVKVADHNHV